MEKVLKTLISEHIRNNKNQDVQKKDSDLSTTERLDIISSKDYSEDDFDKSWNYYTTDANEELLVIYDNVLQELQLLEEKSKY